jgi:hypothetical protein
VAGGWTTGEAAAYPGPDGGRRREDGGRQRLRSDGQQRYVGKIFFLRAFNGEATETACLFQLSLF